MKFFAELLKYLLKLGGRMLDTALLTAVAIFVTQFMGRRANYGQA
jgi:hypothetical protein